MTALPYNAIFEALALADCNCAPGDGTCEDWPSREYRLHYLTAAIWHRSLMMAGEAKAATEKTDA